MKKSAKLIDLPIHEKPTSIFHVPGVSHPDLDNGGPIPLNSSDPRSSSVPWVVFLRPPWERPVFVDGKSYGEYISIYGSMAAVWYKTPPSHQSKS